MKKINYLFFLVFIFAFNTKAQESKTNLIKNISKNDTIEVSKLIYMPNSIPDITIDSLKLTDPLEEISGGNLKNIANSTDLSRLIPPEPVDAGRTAGIIDVSASGSATYTIPIAVPPGINGVVPQIALSYNSQAGPGMAGYGWNISGISTISRIPATLFHDGFVGGVNFDVKDRYALDGQRLILKSGVYGADGAEYQTESFSNIKIFSRGTAIVGLPNLTGPASFEVLYPDGSKAFFNTVTPNSYAITYSQNPLGIKIFYEYTQEYNTLLPYRIRYGGTTEATCNIAIICIYKPRFRNEQYFTGGNFYYNNKILSEINVFALGNQYRNYVLTHNQVQLLNYDRLVSVQEFSANKSNKFEPITFNYDVSLNTALHRTVSNLDVSRYSSANSQILTSDFTGDGKMDFITYPNEKNKIRLYRGEELFPGNPLAMSHQVNTIFEDIFPTSFLLHNNQMTTAQGVLLVELEGLNFKFEVLNTAGAYPLTLQYAKTWNNIPTTPSYFSNCNNANIAGISIPKKFLSGDFNGDGLTDIVAINKAYRVIDSDYEELVIEDSQISYMACRDESHIEYTSKVNFINLDRRLSGNFTNEAGQLQVYYDDNDKLSTGDFDGDGKTDIFHLKQGKIFVYTLDAQNNLKLLCTQNDSRINLAYQPLFGDYNGDGKTDLMFPMGNPNVLFATCMSTGVAFNIRERNMVFSTTTTNWNPQTGVLSTSNLVANDIDGDGKTDILKYFTTTQNGQSTGNLSIYIYHNMGMSLDINAPFFSNGAFIHRTVNLRHYPIPLFLSNDKINTSLEFGILSDNSVQLFNFTKDIKKESQLNNIIQDGVTYEIEYKNLVQSFMNPDLPIYQLGYGQIYPFIDIEVAPSFKVVSKLKRIFNNQQLQQVFGYEAAVSHVTGLGFLGFGKTIKSNWHLNASDPIKLFNININNPQLRGTMVQSFSAKSSYLNPSVVNSFSSGTMADYINRTAYSYNYNLLPNGVFNLQADTVKSKDLLNGTHTTINYTYDSYRNIIKEESNFSGIGIKTTEITYANSPTGTYFIGRPLTKKTTLNNFSDIFTTEEQYTYTDFLPTTIKKKGHNTTFMTDNITYDVFGNVTQKTTLAPNGASRTVTMAYDPAGRFMTKSTDVEGLETNYQYNTTTGNVIKKTFFNNQFTTFQYDIWGRLQYTTDPLNNVSGSELNKIGSNLEIEEFTASSYEKRTLVNALGQTVQVKEIDMFDNWKFKAYQYDIYDRIIKESEPSLDSTNYSQWNHTQYDNFGRIKKIISYTGKTTDISYNGLSTTVNDGSKTTTTNKNALGNITSTQDPGGTINNTYFANGNLKSTTYENSVQTIEQDGWGRKTKLTDPSAGIYRYRYTQFGETWQEFTPKGRTIYIYSPIGKLTHKHIQGDLSKLTNTYMYDAFNKQLITLNFTDHTNPSNSSTTTYTYNTLLQLTATQEDNSSARFTKAFTYDNFGRVLTHTTTALSKQHNKTATKSLRNNYLYNDLLSITDLSNNTTIWQVGSLNNRNQVTTTLLGNNLKETNTFDTFGLPLLSKTERINNNPAQLMALGYNFDAQRGNLISRTNSVFATNEVFTYDNLDRLLQITNNNQNTLTQTYDNRGRISQNNNLGTYTYTGASYQQNGLSNLSPSALAYYQGRSSLVVTYNAFKSPVEITEPGKDKYNFTYNASLQRSSMYYGGEQTDPLQRRYRRHYSQTGDVEFTVDREWGITSFIFYLGGDAYTAPAIWREQHHNFSGANNKNLFYLHRDYQGTILQITNALGQVQENRLFDAWGSIVKITDGSGNILTTLTISDRGYTGHEHLLSIGIIHMNGRLYDPLLHRFLSPDNYVQDPSNTQNFNRYGYVLNNPLSHIDPSGEFIFTILAAIFCPVLLPIAIAADIGGGANLAVKALQGKITSFQDGLAAYGIGAAAGAAGAAIGGAALTAAGLKAASVAGGALAGAVGAGVASPIQGLGNMAYFGDQYSLKSWGKDILFGGVAGGVIGGGIAYFKGKNVLMGGNIANGRSAFSFNNSNKFNIIAGQPEMTQFGTRALTGNKIGNRSNDEWSELFEWGRNPDGALTKLSNVSSTDVLRLKNAGVSVDHILQWKDLYNGAINKVISQSNITAKYRMDLMQKLIQLW